MLLYQTKMYSKKNSTTLLSVFILFLITFSAKYVFAEQSMHSKCSGVYIADTISQKKSSRIRTENLLNYLSLVFDQQQISLEALQNMLRSLEQGQLINPVSKSEAAHNSTKKIIYEGIQASISRGDLDNEMLLRGLREIVKEGTSQEERRGDAHENTLNLFFRPTFHEIRPGEFLMGDAQKPVATEITVPFAMMDTQVTQYMWSRLKIAMGEKILDKINPSHFKTGPESITIIIDDIKVQMQPDHPVENVSWNDVKEFIDGLNQLSNQDDVKIQKLLEQYIPGHKKGDVYDFPTEAQWDFVLLNRGNAKKTFFDRDDQTELPNYAWYRDNSGGQTHAVATRQARMIDGKSFYDLEGNVFEWTKDFWDGRSKLPGGKDPWVRSGAYPVFRGGSWASFAMQLRASVHEYSGPKQPHKEVGFRLVRIRPFR